jgi:hypothetical protein
LSNLDDLPTAQAQTTAAAARAAAAKEQQSSYLENIGRGDDGSSTEKSRGGGCKEMELHIGRNWCVGGCELCSNLRFMMVLWWW